MSFRTKKLKKYHELSCQTIFVYTFGLSILLFMKHFTVEFNAFMMRLLPRKAYCTCNIYGNSNLTRINTILCMFLIYVLCHIERNVYNLISMIPLRRFKKLNNRSIAKL